jgi:hypothetical protein
MLLHSGGQSALNYCTKLGLCLITKIIGRLEEDREEMGQVRRVEEWRKVDIYSFI